MQTSKKDLKERRPDQCFKETKDYMKIDDDIKRELYSKVDHQGLSIRQAAKAMMINYSTAKVLMRMHRDPTFTRKKKPK